MEIKIFRFLLLILYLPVFLCSLYTIDEASKIFKSFNVTEYSKHTSPPTEDGAPLDVEVFVVFHSLSPLTPRYYDLEIDLWLRYQDPRLSFNGSMDAPMKLARQSVDDVWTPDIWVENESVGELQSFDTRMVKIYPNSQIYYETRLQLKMFCPMNYWVFPFDHQKCELTFQSFAYNNKQMRLIWPTGSYELDLIIDFDEEFYAKEYTIVKKNISERSVDYGITGDYDQLIVTLELERDAVYFVLQHFLPLNLNIILSMTTFWIDYNCVKARVTIPLVVVLTLTKQTMALKAILPFSTEPVSLEYYLNFSIFFVFMVLLEYCLIELSKIKAIKERYFSEQKSTMIVVGESGHLQNDENEVKFYSIGSNDDSGTDNKHCIEHPFDRKAQIIFPLFFLAYNVVYFSLLIVNKKQE